MSQNNTLLNETCNALSSALEQIFQNSSMDRAAFMETYNCVTKYFASREYEQIMLSDPSIQRNSTNESDTKEENLEEIHKNLYGGELYFQTRDFFKAYLENIASNGDNLQGEDFLRFYAKAWEKYKFSSKIVNGVLSIINQNWVSFQNKCSVKGIYEIYTMAMHIWQDVFFKEPTQFLCQTCLNLINDERNGARIDRSLIHQVVQSYVETGFVNTENHGTGDRSAYVGYFEKQFLEDTEKFYKLESAKFIENNVNNDYIEKITKRFEEEELRVKDILPPTTIEKLKPLLEDIKQQLQPVQS